LSSLRLADGSSETGQDIFEERIGALKVFLA